VACVPQLKPENVSLLTELVAKYEPSVLCLQEHKLQEKDVPPIEKQAGRAAAELHRALDVLHGEEGVLGPRRAHPRCVGGGGGWGGFLHPLNTWGLVRRACRALGRSVGVRVGVGIEATLCAPSYPRNRGCVGVLSSTDACARCAALVQLECWNVGMLAVGAPREARR